MASDLAEEKLYKLQFGAKQFADGDYLKDAAGELSDASKAAGFEEVKSLGGQWKEN